MLSKRAIVHPRVIEIGKPCLRAECVGVEPVEERQIHAHAEHRILRCVQVHVTERLQDQRVAVIRKLSRFEPLRQRFEHALDHTVGIQHDVTVLYRFELAELRHGQNVAVQNGITRFFPAARIDVVEFLQGHLDRCEPSAVPCDHLTAADVARDRQKLRKEILREQHGIAASAVCDRRHDARRILCKRVYQRVNGLFRHAGLIPHRIQNPVRIAF